MRAGRCSRAGGLPLAEGGGGVFVVAGVEEHGEPDEGLEGLAEAHFVGEDAAEAVFLEVAEPADAVLLVGAEEGFEAGFEGGVGGGGEAAVGAVGVAQPGGRGLDVDAVEGA